MVIMRMVMNKAIPCSPFCLYPDGSSARWWSVQSLVMACP